jgi:hypothetical protein
VPGGGVSPAHSRWIPCRQYRKSFFLPVKVLSRFFRKRFLRHLRKAFGKGRLRFHGECEPFAQPKIFDSLCRKASQERWVVYAKPPFGGPEQVLKYLAPYTHRVAISNRRLLGMQDGHVTFDYKDYAAGNVTRTMTIAAVEFIRRFLVHVLPSGFVHIRHFGFLANRGRRERLALCRTLLAVPPAPGGGGAGLGGRDSLAERQPRLCPICKTGRLVRMQVLPACADTSQPAIVDPS